MTARFSGITELRAVIDRAYRCPPKLHCILQHPRLRARRTPAVLDSSASFLLCSCSAEIKNGVAHNHCHVSNPRHLTLKYRCVESGGQIECEKIQKPAWWSF